MTTGPPPICDACSRLRPLGDRLACEAFPDGIPDEILFEGFDHREPFPGDQGVRFELADGAEQRLANYESSLTG